MQGRLCSLRSSGPERASLESPVGVRGVGRLVLAAPETPHLEHYLLPNMVLHWLLCVVPQQWPLACCILEGCTLLQAPTAHRPLVPLLLVPSHADPHELHTGIQLQAMWHSKRCWSSTFWFPPLPSCATPTAIPTSHLPSDTLNLGIKPRSFHTASHWACRDLTRVSSSL